MKKIFVILSVLFVGLLIGCASKPVVEEKPSSVINEYHIRYSDGSEDIKYSNAIWSGYSTNNILTWVEAKKSKEDICLDDLKWSPEWKLFPENVICENPEKRPYLIKIVNNSDKDTTFWICHKFSFEFKPDYFTTFVVPAHSTKYVKSKVTEKTISFGIGYDKSNGYGKDLGAFSYKSLDGQNNPERAIRCLDEILQTHCCEVIFNGENSEDNIEWLVELPSSYNEDNLIEVDWMIRK